MALWKRLWLLFTVIWLVISGLEIFTILAFSEGEIERAKVVQPLVLLLTVPAALYLVGWAWARWSARGKK